MSSSSHENDDNPRYGSNILKKVSGKRSRKENFDLKWNSKGQAIGENRTIFMSYISMCSRRKADISIPRWKAVPKQIKESIWADISGVFEIPAEKQRWVMRIAGRRWTDLKTTLTNKWIYDKDGNICYNPPLVYPFINQEMWDKFIDSRLSDEFKEKSEKHREIAKKNLYPYRGSRKGYAGIEEELILANIERDPELSMDTSTSTSIPRSLLWKKARIGKDGNMLEPVKQVVAKMDSLSQLADKGEIILSGRQDILAAALGKVDHSGRVTGVGLGISISQYFGRQPRSNVPPQYVEKLNAMEAQMMDLKRMVTELQASEATTSYADPLFPEVTQASDEHEVFHPISSPITSYSQPLFPEGWTQCELASQEPGNPIVATGKVFNTHGTQPVMLHNKPLEPGYMRVIVIEAIVHDAPLPVPSDEAHTVFEVVGAFVAWPKNLIFLNRTVLQSSLRDKDEGMGKPNGIHQPEALAVAPQIQSSPLKLRSAKASKLSRKKDRGRSENRSNNSAELTTMKSTQSRPSQSDQGSVHQQQKLTTLTMKLMYRCVRGMTQLDTVNIDMPLHIMHYEQNILIKKEELLQWLSQEDVQASHVSVYIKYLFNLCQECGTLELFGFLRPQSISPDAFYDEKEKAQYIIGAMKGARKNQIFFAPFYIERHWVLCAIHPHKDHTYWFDPAQNEVHPDIKTVVETATRMFFNRRLRRKCPHYTKWYEIKCPRQSSEVDSGYCILRYMHEVIQRRLDHIPEEYYADTPAPGAYEQHHIDEIRDNWIEFVQNHMD